MDTDTNNTAAQTLPSCMVKDIQFFANPALRKHAPSVNKYRVRFEESEIQFLYWDVELVNILYKKENSNITLKLRCTALTTQKEMYSGEQTVNILSTEIVKTVSGSWGTENSGYWQADQYLWELSVNGSVVLFKTMVIDKQGLVTAAGNPYFDLLETRLYDGNRENTEGIRYLQQFNSSEAACIGVEMMLKRKFTESKSLEFILNIIEAATGLVYVSQKYEILYPAVTAPSTEYSRFRCGNNEPGYWQNGIYLFYISFMGITIASGQLIMGNEEIAGAVKPFDKVVLQAAVPVNTTTQDAPVDPALTELNQLVGMSGIKTAILENIEYLKFNKVRMQKGFADDGQLGLHSIFTGNPGTGKTTIVKLLGKIYKSMGLLSSGHVIEATRADIVGEFIGQTAPKTKAAIEKARGGILFLDEVYALIRKDSANDFGQEAIEIILKEMSDGPGNIAIIGAGYPEEVNAFLNFNPGLKSRFNRHFRFEDYMPDELMQIADVALLKEQALLSNDAREWLDKKFTALYRSRDRNFGNARLVFGIIDEAKKQMGIRLLKNGNIESLSEEELSRIELEDMLKVFEEEQSHKLTLTVNHEELDEALAELDNMTGLQQVKQEVRNRISLVQFYADTGKDVLNRFSLHALLTGNPGTGKTTLARLLGRIYKALGLLERGHVVEVDRQNLVAGYIGQTAIKTAEAINRAMGGILFIDEAYALSGGGENDFGKEAVETILKMMEDQRGKFSVIAAGYTDNMDEFVRSNPGLKSRFDITYHLPDYSCEELFAIAEKQLAAQDLSLQPEAAAHVSAYLKSAYENRDKYFGNARFVRQAVDAIVTAQNLRMASLPREQRTPEILRQVVVADVVQLEIKKTTQRQTIGFKTHN